MDTTLKRLLGLLDGRDVEARCASLLVLTHLRACDEPIVRAVGRLLGLPNVLVRDYALGYFDQARPQSAVKYLAPLLDADEEAVRQRAVEMLVPHGRTAVSACRNLVKNAPRRRLNAIIGLCARIRSAGALDLLFRFMSSDDYDANRAACDALVALVPGLGVRGKADLLARTVTLCGQARGHRSRVIAAAKLFGALGDPAARKPLFAMLSARESNAVRAQALAGLARCLHGKQLTVREIDTLLPLLDEDDEAGILRPAVRLLEDQAIDRRHLARINHLAESPQPVVKRFAVQKLGAFDSTAVVNTLIGYLTDDSYARRDQATASLKTLPGARAALMKEFLACDDERKAWTLADILLLHDRKWKPHTRAALWKKLEGALDRREDRLYAAYFHFLNTLDGGWVAEQVRRRAERLRKSQRFAQCARWLGLLKDSPAWDADTQYAFAIATLKTHRHRSAVARRRDAALDTLRVLGDSPFTLSDHLRRERVLTPEELYYVAFNLAEQRGESQGVARDLLTHLAAKHGRTKIGKAARNKLKLVAT